MNTKIQLSGDPYEAAREAYRALHPSATDQDWEDYLAKILKGANGVFDNFDALARLCNAGAARIDDTNAKQLAFIAWAAGYFEAMGSVTRALTDILPISSYVPHHFQRYQRALINPQAQFE